MSTEGEFVCAIPHVRSARLLLREDRLADFEAHALFAADGEALAHLGGAVDRREAWRRFLVGAGSWVVQGMGWWTLEGEAGETVGTVGVFRRESSPEVEVGWMIYRAFWGRGYATEAAGAAMDWAVRARGVSAIIAHVDHGNEASARVAEKLGMRLVGNVDFYGTELKRYAWEAPTR
jgi:RimJ/RimL family protein N-acetyltransferase